MVPDPDAQPPLVEWAVRINGGAVVVPEVLTGNRPGPIVSYRAARAIRRSIFLSDRFRAAFPEETRVLEACAKQWKVLPDSASFEDTKRAAIKKKTNANVVGCFTEVEVAAASVLPADIIRHIFTRQGFLTFIEQVDFSLSNLGSRQAGAQF